MKEMASSPKGNTTSTGTRSLGGELLSYVLLEKKNPLPSSLCTLLAPVLTLLLTTARGWETMASLFSCPRLLSLPKETYSFTLPVLMWKQSWARARQMAALKGPNLSNQYSLMFIGQVWSFSFLKALVVCYTPMTHICIYHLDLFSKLMCAPLLQLQWYLKLTCLKLFSWTSSQTQFSQRHLLPQAKVSESSLTPLFSNITSTNQ